MALAAMMSASGVSAQIGADTRVVVGDPTQSLLCPSKEGCNLLYVKPDGSPIMKVTQDSQIRDVKSFSARVAHKENEEVLTPPFTCDFEDVSEFDQFSVLDGNNDWNVWEYNIQHFVALMYNSWQSANDYLVTPGMNLKGGFIYTFSTDARAYDADYPEKLELWVGTSPTIEGMTECILPAVTLTLAEWKTQSADFLPETDGVYYFAVRGVSDPDQYALLINNIKVSEGINGQVPSRPAFEAVRDPEGEVLATLKVTAPTLAANGETLTAIDKINLYRDGEVIHTIENVVPGETYTFVDENPTVAEHQYTAECVNEYGAGPAASSICFTGIYYAVWPEVVTPTVGENEGQVELNWTPCLVDQNGNPLREDQVTYSIYRIHAGNVGLLVDGLTEPHYVDQVCEPDAEQRDVQYTVMANTSYGQSAGTGSGIFYAGAPYELPYAESAPNGELSSLLFTRGLANYAAGWDIAKIGDYEYAYPEDGSDNDGGFFFHKAYRAEESAQIGTAKIHIPEDATSATLTFDTFMNGSDDTPNNNTLEVRAIYQGEHTSLAVFSQHGEPGWESKSADLTSFAGKTIQVTWINTVATHVLTMIDNIRVDYETATVGVENVENVTEDAPVYFNLQGIRVAEPSEGQIVIVRKGGKATREIYKK